MAVETQVAGGRLFPRLHWSALIAGVFLAIAVHIVMGLVGATLGFVAEPADSRGVGAAAATWALITPFVATLLGAWLACRMATDDDKRSANLHAILVWCVGLIAGALFLTGTMAAGTMSMAAAASGNLAPAQRMMRSEMAVAPGARASDVRSDQAAKAAAAATGAAALGSIAGLLGAVVAAGISTRRAGRGLGWRIALQRRTEAPGRLAGEQRYAGTPAAPPYSEAPRVPGTPGSPEASVPPTDPYHH